MRTKPSKPVALHIAQGTFRPGRHAKSTATAGEQLEAIPDAPVRLDEFGREKWGELCLIQQRRGLLQSRYLDGLEMLAHSYQRQAHYQAILDKEGEFYANKRGVICIHPAVRQLAQARDEIRRYLTEYGMTPSSSNGIDAAPPSPKNGVPSRKRDLEGR